MDYKPPYEYKLVTAILEEDFNKLINDNLIIGWRLFGVTFETQGVLSQGMVRYSDELFLPPADSLHGGMVL